jgi:bis(5'-nucleosyl)-tetraphosphatase (symmetrical)
MTTYAVGDIQGCLEPLKCLLESVEFDPSKDKLWSVGDIVNRGPSCLDTLRYFYSLRESLVMVLGNHDLHLLAVAAGVRKPHRSDTFDEILSAADRDTLLDWLRQQPLVHHENGHTLVHAGIPPQWSVQESVNYAAEVSSALQGTDPVEFFSQMYGNEPATWSESLTGMTRLRVITNYLTRMRFCTASGELDLQSKRATPDAEALSTHGPDLAPWFTHRDPESSGEKILFGHWASLQGHTGSDRIIGLDTGCVWGGTMSLYALESRTWTHCDCSADPAID